MKDTNHNYFNPQHMSQKDFSSLSRFIQQETGIKMPESKQTMLEGRLRKRLKALGMENFTDYCNYVFSPEGRAKELVHMIDVVATNKTDFFREPRHFEILVKKILPEMVARDGSGIRKRLMIWSAGCSSGEEPYTLAMVLHDFADRFPGFQLDFMILATDLSADMLEIAQKAVYQHDRVESIPMEMRKKFLLRHKDQRQDKIRINANLRNRVKFRRLNLLDDDFGMREPIDIVFYRNVMIYFEPPVQEMILNNITRHVKPGGYVFLGHSENITGLNVPLQPVFPTVYKNVSR